MNEGTNVFTSLSRHLRIWFYPFTKLSLKIYVLTLARRFSINYLGRTTKVKRTDMLQ